jgi:hypothetical protein
LLTILNIKRFWMYKRFVVTVNGRGDPLRWLRDALYPQKFKATSLTSGCRSVGIVLSRTKATELTWYFIMFSGHREESGYLGCNAISSEIAQTFRKRILPLSSELNSNASKKVLNAGSGRKSKLQLPSASPPPPTKALFSPSCIALQPKEPHSSVCIAFHCYQIFSTIAIEGWSHSSV